MQGEVMRLINRNLTVAFLLMVFMIISCEAKNPVQPKFSLFTAASDVIVVYFSDDYDAKKLVMDPLETTKDDWKVNGNHPQEIHHYARSIDELPKTKQGDYPLNMGYWTYLVMDQALVSGRSYTVTGPFGQNVLEFDDSSTFCESIKVNQVGYHPESPVRYANFGLFMGDGGSRRMQEPLGYRVFDISDQQVVYEGFAEYRGNDTLVAPSRISSGEYVYRLNLDEVPTGGPYRIQVLGHGVSHPFEISNQAVASIASVYTRGLYHQRCGIALEEPYTNHTRDVCHTEVAFTRVPWTASGNIEVDPRTPLFEVAGGYHDAGDFDRRPYHTIIPILMLGYYEAFASNFIDGQYSIPESGNGLPDFLDEALWGVRLWKNLQIRDTRDRQFGGIMAGTETSAHPVYGNTNASTDTLVYGTWSVSMEVTAYGAGMMAHAARLLLAFPDQEEAAWDLYVRAKDAWTFLDGIFMQDGSTYTQAKTADMLYASLQLSLAMALFEPTEVLLQTTLQETFISLAKDLLVDDGYWPQQYRPGNITAKIQTVHFSSYLLQDSPTDIDLAQQLEAIVFAQAEKGGYMGFTMETSLYPQGATKAYGWGAATAQGRFADVYAFAYRLEEDAKEKQRYFGILSQFGDYALGLNPLGQSFVTGLGAVQPNSPLHLDSWFTKTESGLGNVPGILIYGPTEERSGADYQKVVSDSLYPDWESLPVQRRWADGWSLVNNNEFSVWETMVWNICLYGVLYQAGSNENSLF
jgi:endoglucanase